MTTHQIRIVQVYRVERAIIIDVEASSLAAAIDLQSDADAPAFSDPRWRSAWSLENEDVEAA